MVNLAPPDGVVALAPPVGVVGLARDMFHGLGFKPLTKPSFFELFPQVKPSENCVIESDEDGAQRLRIPAVGSEDGGVYTCRVSNASGSASCSCTVTCTVHEDGEMLSFIYC